MKGIYLILLLLLSAPSAHGTALDDKLGSVDWDALNQTLASTAWYENISDINWSTIESAFGGPTVQTSPISVEMSMVNVELHPGENRTFTITITNGGENGRDAYISFSGKLLEFISLEKTSVSVPAGAKETLEYSVYIPDGTSIGVYTGELSVRSTDYLKRIPTSIMVVPSKEPLVDIKTEVLTKEIEAEKTLTFLVDLNNIGGTDLVNITLEYTISNVDTEEVLVSGFDPLLLYTTLTYTKNVQLPKETKAGRYAVDVSAHYSGTKATSGDYFEVVRPVPWGIIFAVFGMSLMSVGGLKVKQRYDRIRKEQARYIFPLEYAKLPAKTEASIFVGKIAETTNPTYLATNDLLTHMLIAGGTGFGKTIAAMGIVEEVLKKNIPVVVFDPTLQWTGFLKSCKDERMLSLYKDFGMNKDEARPFKGSLVEVVDPEMEIDLDTYMRPGEITVFGLDKLGPGELDIAVQTVIDSIFKKGGEERGELRCLLVFDEVHRLLPKYGGVKGYEALEKAVREFRRYGVGILLVSQVLSDFKATIHGNIGTEIQMKTKYEGDLLRVERKYGVEYSQTLVREVVGVGMIQNSKYNNGKPYFIHFRPLLHSPARIPESELQEHSEFVRALSKLEGQVKTLKEKGIDTYDFDLEINLAKEKLKQGYASMAKIYLESAEERISTVGNNTGG